MADRRCAAARSFRWCISILCCWLLFGSLAGGQDSGPLAAMVPEVWKRPPAGPLAIDDGVVWYRAVVVPPADWDGDDLALFVEAVDDARQVFFNGRQIGVLGTFPPEFRSGLGQSHRLPIKSGDFFAGEPNVVAIRVYNYHGRRGFNVAAPVLLGQSSAISLQGQWQAFPGDDADVAKLSARFDVPPADWFKATIALEEAERDLRRLADDAGPLSPSEAHPHLRTVADLKVDLVLSEPEIGQPLSLKWDSRGRLWVVEYLQYPDPAGLTAVSRDQFLRTVWDRLPAAPPNHFPGADRITVHEDTNGDGVYDSHHVFVDGLSLVTSMALDRDGVWVLNPPHLLFYPDRDGDAVADGDPEVHLEGFGLEDAHAVANSLRWGPDGWLYAAQGSTVSAEVRHSGSSEGPHRSVGQLIWRYHPKSRKYEVFSEGGGNAFGVEIDSQGRVFSGHNGGDTRGFHYLPGAYFRKGFGKHGELSNPFAFGFFEAMGHHRVERFTHTFVIQESESLPQRFRGHLFGVEPLQGRVVLSRVEPDGSTFKTTDVEHVLWSEGDNWFRPVDIQEGPDGALYVADFYEQRIDHASHAQGRIHRGSGRIYRIRGADAGIDFNLPEPDDLNGWLDSFASPIRWQRQTALRRVVELADESTKQRLIGSTASSDENEALGSLWAIAQLGLFDEALADRLLKHPLAPVREWTVRLLGESGQLTEQAITWLTELAHSDGDAAVRVQLAATARQLPVQQALAVINPLISSPESASDNRLPLMLWWVIETKISEDADAVVQWWTSGQLWKSLVVREELAERMMRRFAAVGTRKDLLVCATLLQSAPDRAAADKLLSGFEAAYRGRSLASLPDELIAVMSQSGGGSLPLRVRRGDPAAVAEVLAIVADPKQKAETRTEYLAMLGDVRPAAAQDVLLTLVTDNRQPEKIHSAALSALQGYESEAIAGSVLDELTRFSSASRDVALTLIASRPQWTRRLLDRIEAGKIDADVVPAAVVRKIHLHRDEAIRAAVGKHWGEISGATTAEMEANIDRYRSLIETAIGNPRVGKQLFAKHCGTCHRMFGDGGHSGPDLTSYQRQDVRGMVVHIVNPSLEIREGFENYLVLTEDGRAINGLIADSDHQVVVIRDASGQTRVIAREEILEMTAVPQSLMPEGLLDPLSDQQVRDLFAYLRSRQPVP
jgi:putative heme-binding domain-containing protein